MGSVADNKCPSCGANIKFNPKTQKWDCEYCGSSYEKNVFEQNQKEEKSNNIDLDINIDEYTCPNCGAKVITDENTVATHCVYCGNTTIMKNRIHGELKPNKIIPFKSVKEDAINAFSEFVSKRWFAPKMFKSKENIEKVSGVYIPFWLYDGRAEGEIIADAKRITHWSDSSYNYTKTDIYKCSRSGYMDFIDVPVDGSIKFEDDIMDSIEPYDYKEFIPFNYSYLSGFLAEKYNLTQDKVYVRAKKRMNKALVDAFKKSIDFSYINIIENNSNINKGEVEYALLPVWLLNINYKNKTYTFAMNGQTQKMVGDVPVDIKKVIKISAICFGITWVISYIINTILGLI